MNHWPTYNSPRDFHELSANLFLHHSVQQVLITRIRTGMLKTQESASLNWRCSWAV